MQTVLCGHILATLVVQQFLAKEKNKPWCCEHDDQSVYYKTDCNGTVYNGMTLNGPKMCSNLWWNGAVPGVFSFIARRISLIMCRNGFTCIYMYFHWYICIYIYSNIVISHCATPVTTCSHTALLAYTHACFPQHGLWIHTSLLVSLRLESFLFF